MADHGEPCNEIDASYCMNGGTCFNISFMQLLTCVCNENYRGSRCEQYQLPITAHDAVESGLIAAVVIIVLLILVVLAVLIYYACKVLSKTKHRKKSSEEQYVIVQPEV